MKLSDHAPDGAQSGTETEPCGSLQRMVRRIILAVLRYAGLNQTTLRNLDGDKPTRDEFAPSVKLDESIFPKLRQAGFGYSELRRAYYTEFPKASDLSPGLPILQVQMSRGDSSLYPSGYRVCVVQGRVNPPNARTEPSRASDIQSETKSENGVGSSDLLDNKTK